MKNLYVTATLLAASCAMPTEPLSTSTAALGASWYDVRDEGRRVCAVVDAEGCAYTRQTWWWPACLASAVRLADEAQAANCLDYAEDMQRCEWAEQERICWGVFPYQIGDACSIERWIYQTCRSGS